MLSLLWLSGVSVWAQSPILEARISLRVVNEPLDNVLRLISQKGQFNFSYSPDAINVKSRVTLTATNQTVREILTGLFDGTVTFRQRRSYVILQKAVVSEKKQPDSFYLNGYITDAKTGEKLANASIYEPVSLVSTVSNQFGYYKIKLPLQPEGLTLEVRKEAYSGRTVPVVSRKDTYLTIPLSVDTLQRLASADYKLSTRHDTLSPKIEIPVFTVSNPPTPDTVEVVPPVKERNKESIQQTLQTIRNGLIYAFSTAKQAIHTENISDTLHRTFQASILPFIGTNHQLSGNVVNDISLNLIAGYSMGVNAFEMGGVLNVVRKDVHGVQLAGAANAVGRNVSGLQLAGAANLVVGDVDGFQASGAINLAGRDFYGLQMASALNLTGRDFQGMQLSSGANIVAGTLNGWQISSGLNYAGKVRSGHQIGLVNYADSSATTPFGLFSFVKKNGYRRLELATDEFNIVSLTFKTGVPKFYTLFTLGTSGGFVAGKPLGSFGFGLGTARSWGRGWMFNADLISNQVAIERLFSRQPNVNHYRIAVAVEKKISPRLAFSIGPTFNLLYSSYKGLLNNSYAGLEPLWIGGKPTSQNTTYGWLGFQMSLRLCNRLFEG
ncbi:hypothetical protein EZE20_03750 [Arundinibacter roseus]|uniref:Secretin/TonB short N-terminal domain-containing protein n=1 Tax=Arundinibacter roseus TaxID=2070510 RepID=A0A4R4KNW7_9BACT|nr:hypothetical protein EZE20_03750 [Arundinibacter roseus]